MTGGSGATVLVVDDEPAIRLLVRVNLELEGHDVLEAASLSEARRQLATAHVDVVLLDLHLAGETSHELIAECRARTPAVGVAVVTGSAEPAAARAAGAEAVLPKPFAIGELLRTVERLVPRTQASR